MALPSAYFTSTKNTAAIFQAIQTAQAPQRFTTRFLAGLGYANANDRTMINVLKALRFLDDTGVPLKRYHEYLDQTQSASVLSEALRDAYEDLFRVNIRANEMTLQDVKNKMKTLSEGQYSDRVLTQMATTFTTLAKLADFSKAVAPPVVKPEETPEDLIEHVREDPLILKGLVYNINLHLPESRDPAVYDALFKSLKQHLS
jgi:DNA-binding transcriptional MerR regulator